MAKNKEIAKLFITLGIDEKAYKTQLKAIDKETKAIGKTAVAVGASIVAGIGAATMAWAKAGDEIDKMRQRTNWSAESLSELKYVADISGASLESLEKSTRKLNQSISDGASGLATYNRYFDTLGLSAVELKNMGAEEAFWTVAEAAAGLTNEVEQTAIMAQLFGRSGTQLLPMLKSGAAGIEELRQEAHELGIVFDESAASKAAQLNDTITTLTASVKGLVYEIGEAASPTIQTWASQLTDATKSANEFADENKGLVDILVNMALSFGGAATAIGVTILALPKLLQLAAAAKVGIGALSLSVAGLTAGLTLIGTGIGMLMQFHSRQDDMQEKHAAMAAEITKANQGMENSWEDSMDAYADSLELYVQIAGLSAQATRRYEEEIRAMREKASQSRKNKQTIEEWNAANEEQIATTETLINKYQESQTAATLLGLTVDDITGYIIESGRELELYGLDWDAIGTDAQAMADALGLAIDDVARKTGKLKDETSELRDEIQSVIDQFLYEESAAGQLNVTYDDIVAALFSAGLSVDSITEKLEKLGEEEKDVNAILRSFGLTAEEIAGFSSGETSASSLLRTMMQAANRRGVDIGEIGVPSYDNWNGPVPGPVGTPQLAVVHGGEIISQRGQASGIVNNFNISSLTVREEADVQRIARELYRMQQART